MMEYERFTKRIGDFVTNHCKPSCPYWNVCEDDDCHCDKAALEILADLEDKIEQGTLIELPCKVDSEIYIVDCLIDDEEERYYYIRKSVFHPKWIDEWRNMFYLTREEAEKRLKELQNG